MKKVWKPPIPTRCIHARSSAIPSLVMLPFIQCHQTRGLALSGGATKPASRSAAGGALTVSSASGDTAEIAISGPASRDALRRVLMVHTQPVGSW
jgi:hypothetical protein